MREYCKEADIKKDIEIFTNEYFKSECIRKLPKHYKYVMGEQVRNAILEMDKSFCKAWKSSIPVRKLIYFEDANGLVMFVQNKLNCMNDIGILDNKTKAKFDILTERIDKQLLNMTNSLRRKHKLAESRSIVDGLIESDDRELKN